MSTPDQQHGRLLTVKEAAERLQFHENTVRHLVRIGELAAHRRKGKCSHIRITEAALDDYLHGNSIR